MRAVSDAHAGTRLCMTELIHMFDKILHKTHITRYVSHMRAVSNAYRQVDHARLSALSTHSHTHSLRMNALRHVRKRVMSNV